MNVINIHYSLLDCRIDDEYANIDYVHVLVTCVNGVTKFQRRNGGKLHYFRNLSVYCVLKVYVNVAHGHGRNKETLVCKESHFESCEFL